MKLGILERISVALSLAVLAACFSLFFALGKSDPFAAIRINSKYAREASFWRPADLGVRCDLCPVGCFITEGAKGRCRVRMNRGGVLYTEVWGQAVSLNVDPIEKKPVYHMLPGSTILSFSTVGCPLRCEFCQNWSISQAYPEEVRQDAITTPETIVNTALTYRIPSIAYTYGEPAAFYEYMYETAKLAHEHGLRNVIVTSGYINPGPLEKIAPYLDVVKVDLKGMSDEFYGREVGGRLGPVLDTLRLLRRRGVLVEVVNLVVPTRNDSPEDIEKLAIWIRDNLGADCPLFFTRFHPDYKLTNLPPTPVETLVNARRTAIGVGLNFVYVGNVPGNEGENTCCPDDGTILVKRSGYLIKRNVLRDGRCPVCGRKIPGIWR